MKVALGEKVLKANDLLARENRAAFDRAGVRAINFISSPGAGKTTLLEQTIARLCRELRIGAIEGDLATELDAQRIRRAGARAVQINTRGCHLDAALIDGALRDFDLEGLDLLFIENVGNLVCPVAYDLGEHHRAVILSVSEGDDKPLKYPASFRGADFLLMNKIDLLPHSDFDPEKVEREVWALSPEAALFRVSARTGEGIDGWCRHLRSLMASESQGGKIHGNPDA